MTNRYIPPQAPLHADYTPPSPPRTTTPGTKDVKSKAGNIGLSVCCGAVAIWLWQNAADPWRYLTLPLFLGACWPFLPMLGDWFAVWQARKAGSVYNFAHDALVRALANSDAEYSEKHNRIGHSEQRIALSKPAEQLRVEQERDAALAKLRTQDLPTRLLERYTPDMRQLVTIALGNEVRIVSERKARALGMTDRAYLAARNDLVKAGILYQADNGYFYLSNGYSSHAEVTERLAA